LFDGGRHVGDGLFAHSPVATSSERSAITSTLPNRLLTATSSMPRGSTSESKTRCSSSRASYRSPPSDVKCSTRQCNFALLLLLLVLPSS